MKVIRANKYQGLLKRMDEGGISNPVLKGNRSVSKTKLDDIKERQIAPLESLLRKIVMKQKLKRR